MEQRQRDKRADLLSPTTTDAESGRAIVVEPWLKREVRGVAARSPADTRTPDARLAEAVGSPALSTSMWCRPDWSRSTTSDPPPISARARSMRSPGWAKSLSASVVVMDCAVSPVQQRNLEKAWNAKVIDRTG